jgi:ABC-type uncharacterized transport system involved in gliding motility auxiliary subunit/ABC-type transport system involved in multi-copper enzyme maturation permease subunit
MIRAIAGRELRSLFFSPLAWLLLGLMQFILAWLFLIQVEEFMQLQPQLATLETAPGVTDLVVMPLLDSAALILMLVTPLISMRLLSDEYRNGTIRLLLSAPVSTTSIVLGKYLALIALLAVVLLMVALMPLSLLTGAELDLGKLASGLIGLGLMLATYAAIGLYFSSLTSQPAVAAVSTYGLLLFLRVVNHAGDGQGSGIFDWLSLSSHYSPLLSGLLHSSDIVYFLLLPVAALSLAIHRLDGLRGQEWTMNGRSIGQVAARIQGILFYLLLATAVALCAWLSKRYDQAWDWSANGRNSLSETSQNLLARLQGPLEITSFSPENPELRRRIGEIVERYRRVSPHIRFKFVNPAIQPAMARELGIRVSGELHLRYQGRSENLQSLDEQSISNAIQRLIQQGERWIVEIGGHGERRLDGQANHDLGQFGQELKTKGFLLQPLDLASHPRVPDNTSLLLVASPQVAYLPGELEIIRRYLEQGGNLLWLTDPGQEQLLAGLAGDWGVSLLPGTVVDANAADLGLDNPAVALVPRYPQHPATLQFRELSLFPHAAALGMAETESWQATPLLQTLERSWNETGPLTGEISLDPEAWETPGPLTIGVALTREREGHQQRILVIGDGDFLSNAYLGNAGNLNLGLNLTRWLVADDNLLDIPAKTARDLQLSLSPAQGAAIGLGFLVFLPLFLIGTGTLVWWRRRKL